MADKAKESNGVAIPVTWSFIRNWLPIIVLIGGLVFGWGVMGNRIANLETRVAEMQVRMEKRDDLLVNIQVQLAGIQTQLVNLQKSVDLHMQQAPMGAP